MDRKLVLVITLLILLAGMLGLVFKVQRVKARGTIYIRANGLIEPLTADISSADNVTYYFTDNIYDAIVVERSNIIIDGKGFAVQGSGSGYGLNLDSVNNVTIKNTSIEGFYAGVYLKLTSQSVISGTRITANSDFGIMGYSSSNNTISGNNIENNWYGIWLSLDSSNNNIFRNNITANNWQSISLYTSNNNTVSENRIASNQYGIWLSYSSSNTISRNNITANIGYGIKLEKGVSNNSIFGNNITNNGVGIELVESSNNRFFHNNFIDNTKQVDILTSGYANIWDDGYPSGGNYWSNYASVDANGDGIGDTPYIFDADNKDNYPLMEPYSPPPLYTLTILSSPIGGITFTVDNTPCTTPWSGTYSEGASVDLVIPETHDGYDWFKWEDGDTSRIRTVTMDKDITLTCVFTDTTLPVISIVSPENKTYLVNDVSLTFNVSESPSWTGYSLDGQINVTISSNTTIFGLSDGVHFITVYANDTAGNMGFSDVVYFTIDTVPPSIKILSPEDKPYTTDSISVIFTVDESTSWIGYSLDGQSNVTIYENTTLSGLPDGSHRLIVFAKDVAGNIGVSQMIYFSTEYQQEAQQPELLPPQIVVVMVVVIVGVIGPAALIYARDRREH